MSFAAPLSFDDVLSELQGLLGREVLLSIAPVGDPVPFLTVTGVLERGTPSPDQEILVLLNRARPGDEAVHFKTAPGVRLTLSRRQFRQVGKGDPRLGDDLWIEHAGTIIKIADADAARATAASLSADD